MYIFPRQFGLHNAFTSKVNFKETAQRLKDYTLREEEIFETFGRLNDSDTRVRMPKRLRGTATELVRKLQISHQRCSYSQLLQHHCPVSLPDSETPSNANSSKLHASLDSREIESTEFNGARKVSRKLGVLQKKTTQQSQGLPLPAQSDPVSSIFDLATPAANISAFCQAVLKKIVPSGFWGSGSAAEHNETLFLKKVDHFILLRRFEGMSLHEVMQGMNVSYTFA